jgi:hypothetical protein
VKEVSEILKLRGLKKLPVLDTNCGQCVGIVDKFTLEKAESHNLHEESIEHFMDSDFETLRPDSWFDNAAGETRILT